LRFTPKTCLPISGKRKNKSFFAIFRGRFFPSYDFLYDEAAMPLCLLAASSFVHRYDHHGHAAIGGVRSTWSNVEGIDAMPHPP
jgi:hypothetical protein